MLKRKKGSSPLYLQMARNLFLFLTLFTLVLSVMNYALFNQFLNRQACETNAQRLAQVKERTELILQEVVNLSYSIAADPTVYGLLGKPWELADCYHDLIALQQRLKAAGSASACLHSLYVYSGVNQKLLTTAGTYRLDEFYDRAIIEQSLLAGGRAAWLDARDIRTYGETYERVITLMLAMPASAKAPTDLLAVT